MRTKMLTCAVAASAALLVAACGSDSNDDASTDTTQAEAGSATTAAETPANAVVDTGQTDLGEVLTDADGLTLYAFTPDSAGQSTCEGDCAAAWPPLTVDSEELPAGLDASEFSVIERSDGTYQLASLDHPLYTFGGDSAPGDVNGQGVADKWYAVDATGHPIDDDEAGGEPASDTDTTPADAGNDSGY
jgi:predicted lipoprotein with Yx(FWY)xxD motif